MMLNRVSFHRTVWKCLIYTLEANLQLLNTHIYQDNPARVKPLQR